MQHDLLSSVFVFLLLNFCAQANIAFNKVYVKMGSIFRCIASIVSLPSFTALT
uniref:Uncharacterized protein n=1 Tax=Rhizophora mucronata TaxID=61149 RepID=A0A2P2P8A6_RHIMU